MSHESEKRHDMR